MIRRETITQHKRRLRTALRTCERDTGIVAILRDPPSPAGHVRIVVKEAVSGADDGFGGESICQPDARRDPAIPGVLRESSSGAPRPTPSKSNGPGQIARAGVRKGWVKIRKMILRLEWGWIHFPMNARRNRQFRRYAPRVPCKQTETLSAGIDVS